MTKEEFIELLPELLSDPDVVGMLRAALLSKKPPISMANKKAVDKVVKYWCDKTNTVFSPTTYQTEALTASIKHYGNSVYTAIDNALNSPLRTSVGYMNKYLNDIMWVLKPTSVEKLINGAYSSASTSAAPVYRNKTSEQNLNLNSLLT